MICSFFCVFVTDLQHPNFEQHRKWVTWLRAGYHIGYTYTYEVSHRWSRDRFWGKDQVDSLRAIAKQFLSLRTTHEPRVTIVFNSMWPSIPLCMILGHVWGPSLCMLHTELRPSSNRLYNLLGLFGDPHSTFCYRAWEEFILKSWLAVQTLWGQLWVLNIKAS